MSSGLQSGFRGLWAEAVPHIQDPVNPAAGASYSQALDGRYWWSLQAVTFTLVTDTNAANRLLTIQTTLIDGRPFILGEPTVVQTVNTTQRYVGAVTLGGNFSATNTDVVFGLSDFPLLGGRTFTITIGNVQAGDQLSNIVLAWWRLPTAKSVVEQFAGESE